MNILLGFAPFIVFAVLAAVARPMDGLVAAALVAVAMVGRDVITPGRRPKKTEIATLALFGGLVLYGLFGHAAWSVTGIRLCVDSGLLLLVVASMVTRRPFTLQYAREQTHWKHWHSAEFQRTNYIITSAWALAFLVMVLAEIALLNMPDLPRRAGMIAIVLALAGAVMFTGWYTEESRKRYFFEKK